MALSADAQNHAFSRSSKVALRALGPRALLSVSLMALWLANSGCTTFSGYSTRPLASVTVWNRPRDDIDQAAQAVFAMNGYVFLTSGPNQLTFQRAGSTEDNVAYGSLFWKRSVVERVVLTISLKENGAAILGCAGTLVEGAGDTTFEDSHKISDRTHKKEYQELLEQIQSRLKAP